MSKTRTKRLRGTRPRAAATVPGTRNFNPKKPLPADVRRFRSALVNAYGHDRFHYREDQRMNGPFSQNLKAKLAERRSLAKLMEEIGGDPVMPWYAMKEELNGSDKFEEYLDLLFIHLVLIGIKINQGGGGGGMELIAKRYRRAMKLVEKYPSLTPIWKPGVISTSLLIEEEPSNGLHESGWHVGPWRALPSRTDCLMGGLGFIPAVGALPCGDSGMLEVYATLCAAKPAQRSNLDSPYADYPFGPPVIYVEHEKFPFWGSFFDNQDCMIRCRRQDAGSRKINESKKRRTRWFILNGDIATAAANSYNIVDASCQSHYGGSPADEFLKRNGLQISLSALVQKIYHGLPL